MPLPISKARAKEACMWLKDIYGDEMKAAVFGPFTVDHLCGIACQETACYWLPWISGKDALRPDEICARCVFDASGDVTGTTRTAFPRTTAAFRAKYGADFTDMLIAEGNLTRKLRGYKPWNYVYRGYGIFQYDLQFVLEDESFFRLKQWGDFRKSLDRCLKELRRTYAKEGNVSEAIRAYNGSGPRARAYRDNVLIYVEVSAAV